MTLGGRRFTENDVLVFRRNYLSIFKANWNFNVSNVGRDLLKLWPNCVSIIVGVGKCELR